MGFGVIKDQPVATRLLGQLIQRGRIPHGLLFWGEGGVGKRTTAIAFAQALNCPNRTSEGAACGACLSCTKVDHGNHPGVRIFAPVKKSRNIDVDTVEAINDMASLRVEEGTWRVVILLDAERMRPPAQNHFLKTLEEPPGRTVFVLVSEFPRMLLPTIRSRCQMVRFQALRPETVHALLRHERDLSGGMAEAIALLAQGRMDRALDLVDSEKREIAISVATRLAEGGNPSALATEFTKALATERDQLAAAVRAESPSQEEASREERDQRKEEQDALVDALARRTIFEYLYLLQTWYRDEMVLSATGDANRIFNRDRVQALEAGVSSNPAKKIAAIERARLYLERFIQDARVLRSLFFALAER